MSIAPTAEDAPYVLVIGSANVDVSVKTAVLPRPGETVIGSGIAHIPGRQGSKPGGCRPQPAARRRISWAVLAMMPSAAWYGKACSVAVCNWARCGPLREPPRESPRSVSRIRAGTGIIVVPGANALLRPPDLDESIPLIRGAAVVVLQCEIPMATMYRVVELAAQSGTAVMLNPAPFIGLDVPRIAGAVTYLVPNETEAGEMAGHPVETLDQALECARGLQVRGMECVIITLGARGLRRCRLRVHTASRGAFGGGDRHHRARATRSSDVSPPPWRPVRSRDESVRRALLYSALSTTRRGAQDSYASAREFEHALGATGPA